MAEYLNMAVTPNVEYCLEILKKAVKELPEGISKTNAGYALEYLENASTGAPQPNGGEDCSPPIKIMPLEGE